MQYSILKAPRGSLLIVNCCLDTSKAFSLSVLAVNVFDLIGVYAVDSLFYVLGSVIYQMKAVIARISISAD